LCIHLDGFKINKLVEISQPTNLEASAMLIASAGKRSGAIVMTMDNPGISGSTTGTLDQTYEEILTYTVSDEALEAAGMEGPQPPPSFTRV
jgi:hypothetical protein